MLWAERGAIAKETAFRSGHHRFHSGANWPHGSTYVATSQILTTNISISMFNTRVENAGLLA